MAENKDQPEGGSVLPTDPKVEEATGGVGSKPSPLIDPAGSPKFDRAAYMRSYMRGYRTRKRLEKAEKLNENG